MTKSIARLALVINCQSLLCETLNTACLDKPLFHVPRSSGCHLYSITGQTMPSKQNATERIQAKDDESEDKSTKKSPKH
jgi:hypothetical protein